MWVEYIHEREAAAIFAPGASTALLGSVERALDTELPSDLRDLLTESNGVRGEYESHLVWDCQEIQERNRQLRNEASTGDSYMPLDPLLFFADAGNGQLFAFSINHGKVRRPDIYTWNPIDDSRTWVAPSLQQYLEWWLAGKIRL